MRARSGKGGQGIRPGVKLGIIIGSAFAALWLGMYFFEPSMGQSGPDTRLSLGDSFWFTLVTITTVGYGDMSPSTFMGRLIAIMMMMFSVGIFSFLVTNIQNYVAEQAKLRELGMDGTKFTGHVVVCSFSQISMVALKELLAAGRQVAFICEKAENIPMVRELGNKQTLFVTVGDPTSEEAMNRANVLGATTVIAASHDDTQNLIIALEIRRRNPNARIVVSTKRGELRNTLTSSGVTYVASPFEMSGRLVASAAFEPDVARFVDDVTSGADDEEGGEGGYDLQQFTLPQGNQLCNQNVAYINATLRNMQGPLLVAVSKHMGSGKYKLFPHPDDQMPITAYDSLIVLGNDEQNDRVSTMLGVIQGR